MAQIKRYRHRQYTDCRNVQLICKSVSQCMKAIKGCKKAILDGKNIRTTKRPSNSATKWEIRKALHLPDDFPYNAAQYKAQTAANGDVTVTDKQTGKIYPITAGELSELESEYYEKRNPTTNFSSPVNGNVNAINRQLINHALGFNNGQQAVQNQVVQNNEQKGISKIVPIIASVTAATALVGTMMANIDKIASSQNAMNLLNGIGSKIKGLIGRLIKSKKEVSDVNNATDDKYKDLETKLNDTVNDMERMKSLVEKLMRDNVKNARKASRAKNKSKIGWDLSTLLKVKTVAERIRKENNALQNARRMAQSARK